ncbi:hypothetical protein [Solirubrobacter deserti]|nr:hypothetical protein [Solirubrobacter deserti]
MDQLVAALGNRPEARLLEEGAWVGPTVPKDAGPGDLWLDTVELMPMRLVPREHPPYTTGWVATRPVERWQFAAFLELADIRHGEGLFDRERILDGPESGPVTKVLREEADLYAHWFGKILADRITWQLVVEAPGGDPADDWGLVAEWDNEAYEGAYGVVTPDAVYKDADELPTFSAFEAPDGVFFRTFVHPQLGLTDQLTRAPEIPAELRNVAPRQ